MIHLIPTYERDGKDVKVYYLIIEAENGMTRDNIRDAIQKASTAYCITPEGRTLYENNQHRFSYRDFDKYVSNDICEQYGIKKVVPEIKYEKPIEFDRQLIYENDILDNDSTSEPELNVKYKYALVGTATSSVYVAENLDNAIHIVEKLKPKTDSILFLFNTEGICVRQIAREKNETIHLYTPHESLHGVKVEDEHITGLLKSLNEKH